MSTRVRWLFATRDATVATCLPSTPEFSSSSVMMSTGNIDDPTCSGGGTRSFLLRDVAKYSPISLAWSVALITTNLNSLAFILFCTVFSAFTVSERKSASTVRSCASSITTCVYGAFPSSRAPLRLRNSHPVVQNSSRVDALMRTSCPTAKPTSPPTSDSPRSFATRRDRLCAASRRGCVMTMRAFSFRAIASSSNAIGIAVDFPHPVSPQTHVTRCARTAAMTSCLFFQPGRRSSACTSRCAIRFDDDGFFVVSSSRCVSRSALVTACTSASSSSGGGGVFP
mmetsp:Transcript_2802/g.7160  ORF Transcript_2802/g.7160 Transcript_2802/m.7160 type:complete len:283 (-) Transcript_2802:316-1164(-)